MIAIAATTSAAPPSWTAEACSQRRITARPTVISGSKFITTANHWPGSVDRGEQGVLSERERDEQPCKA